MIWALYSINSDAHKTIAMLSEIDDHHQRTHKPCRFCEQFSFLKTRLFIYLFIYVFIYFRGS